MRNAHDILSTGFFGLFRPFLDSINGLFVSIQNSNLSNDTLLSYNGDQFLWHGLWSDLISHWLDIFHFICLLEPISSFDYKLNHIIANRDEDWTSTDVPTDWLALFLDDTKKPCYRKAQTLQQLFTPMATFTIENQCLNVFTEYISRVFSTYLAFWLDDEKLEFNWDVSLELRIESIREKTHPTKITSTNEKE